MTTSNCLLNDEHGMEAFSALPLHRSCPVETTCHGGPGSGTAGTGHTLRAAQVTVVARPAQPGQGTSMPCPSLVGTVHSYYQLNLWIAVLHLLPASAY